MNITSYAAEKQLEHILGLHAFTAPAGVYLALLQADPTATGDLTSELSGSGYTRQLISFGEESGNTCYNDAAITFGPATADWGVVSHIGIMDASTAGNMLFYAPLRIGGNASAANVQNGQTLKFNIGDLYVSVS